MRVSVVKGCKVKQAELPDVDDMLKAGMPLWAAFQFWSEMMSNQDKSIEYWWNAVSLWPKKPTTH